MFEYQSALYYVHVYFVRIPSFKIEGAISTHTRERANAQTHARTHTHTLKHIQCRTFTIDTLKCFLSMFFLKPEIKII